MCSWVIDKNNTTVLTHLAYKYINAISDFVGQFDLQFI